MKKIINPLACAVLSLVMMPTSAQSVDVKEQLSPSQIINNAPKSSWRSLDLENTLIIELQTGSAVVELNPLLAPNHVENTKQLVRSGFYKDLNMYRFVEGFVAQGGDITGEKKISKGSRRINAELSYKSKKQLAITPVTDSDGYANSTGFLNGFAVAQNNDATETWQAHCPGVFAMARENDINSGGTEFYVVLGHATRYLDRNTTAYGRVVTGMEHFQRLQRKPKKEVSDADFNPIKSIQVASDLNNSVAHSIEVLKTSSHDFSQLINARKNRPEAWFVTTPDYTDVCAVTIPNRQKGTL